MFGSVVCPAMDALTLLLKHKMPSFKKKGAVPSSVKTVQTALWGELREGLKLLAQQFEGGSLTKALEEEFD